MAKKLLRNLHVLNLLLLAITLGFIIDRLLPLMDSPVVYKPPRVTPSPLKALEEPASSASSANPLEYTVIAEQNLFHPDRKIPPEKKAEAPLPKPEFVLYGTLVTGNMGIAYLEDKKAAPVTTAGRGKRQTALNKGESMSGFILKDIQADRVTMTRGEETLVVSLNDPQNPKAREGAAEPARPTGRTVPPVAAPEAKAGAAPAPGPAPTPTPAAATRPAPSVPVSGTPTPGMTSPNPGVSSGVTPARPRYRPLPPSSGGGPYPAPSPIAPSVPTNPYP